MRVRWFRIACSSAEAYLMPFSGLPGHYNQLHILSQTHIHIQIKIIKANQKHLESVNKAEYLIPEMT